MRGGGRRAPAPVAPRVAPRRESPAARRDAAPGRSSHDGAARGGAGREGVRRRAARRDPRRTRLGERRRPRAGACRAARARGGPPPPRGGGGGGGAARGAPAIKLVNSLLARAIEEGASDIHFEPQASGLVVRARIDGVTRRIAEGPISLPPAVHS